MPKLASKPQPDPPPPPATADEAWHMAVYEAALILLRAYVRRHLPRLKKTI